jgi:hypothetical protein
MLSSASVPKPFVIIALIHSPFPRIFIFTYRKYISTFFWNNLLIPESLTLLILFLQEYSGCWYYVVCVFVSQCPRSYVIEEKGSGVSRVAFFKFRVLYFEISYELFFKTKYW